MASTPFNSQIVATIGISAGDEGKGRVVHEVINDIMQEEHGSNKVAAVIKVNGGANSGHTAAGLKLNLLPAGVKDKSVGHLALGAGVVADPRKLWWEIKPLEAAGYNVYERLLIDERTLVSDLSHRLLDLACENYRRKVLKEESRGSTGRGITPAFADETGQWQIFFSDFKGAKDYFAQKFKQRIGRVLAMIKDVYQVEQEDWNGFFTSLTENETRANQMSIDKEFFSREEYDFVRFQGEEAFTLDEELLIETYWEKGTALNECIGDIRELVLEALGKGEYLIGEFGQSFWLDKRHGFSPNVTASHTYTPEFFLSTGTPLQPTHAIGCCKAYDTKVGTHLFLTQMLDQHPLAKHLKELEFGSTTGRQRMVGWFDAVEKADALRYAGYQDLVINKLDALTYQGDWQGGELLICVAYRGEDGTMYYNVPRNDHVRRTLQPVYQQYSGWSEPINDVRSFEDLPENAQNYVRAMVKCIVDLATRKGSIKELPNVLYIGVGPDPGEVIKDVPSTKELLNNNKENVSAFL